MSLPCHADGTIQIEDQFPDLQRNGVEDARTVLERIAGASPLHDLNSITSALGTQNLAYALHFDANICVAELEDDDIPTPTSSAVRSTDHVQHADPSISPPPNPDWTSVRRLYIHKTTTN
jgi:hypothetical protein